MKNNLLEVRDLAIHFRSEPGTVVAVDRVTFDVGWDEVVGMVGESGCGKTVTALSILQLIPWPGKIVSGVIKFYPERTGISAIDLLALDPEGEEMRNIRGGKIGMIFQEPMTAFSPVHTVGDQIMENILLHDKFISKKEARDRTIRLLQEVGIPRPEQRVVAYPFELSGGMRQRAMIAMALACYPSLLIADEPTTSVDVTIQAQILELIKQLQSGRGMSVLLITHNLGIIAEMADRVVVMYLGSIVESGTTKDILENPQHPYTAALLRSIPRLGEKSRQPLHVIKGVVPPPHARPHGCPFAPRCEKYMGGICDRALPPLVDVGNSHEVRCYLYVEGILTEGDMKSATRQQSPSRS